MVCLFDTHGDFAPRSSFSNSLTLVVLLKGAPLSSLISLIDNVEIVEIVLFPVKLQSVKAWKR